MAMKYFRILVADSPIFKNYQVRHGHRLRGLPPTKARSLKQRLEEMEAQNQTLPPVNIGFKVPKISRQEIINSWIHEVKTNRADPTLEKKSRSRSLLIDLEEVNKVWTSTIGFSAIYKMGCHYGVFRDLFGNAFFKPVLPIEVSYSQEDDRIAQVYRGNVIKPQEACNVPDVVYNAPSDSLWTLLLTTPDGNMHHTDNEYCHWFIGNIPGNCISKGEELIDYLRPIPQRGIGYCRYIFILYKQTGRIDYREYKKEKPCINLADRDWKTLDFYRNHEDQLTPASLAFFQSDWDISLTNFYHEVLQMSEPVFEYDFPLPYKAPQKWFPIRRAFDTYLDNYRDPKEIKKEYLLKKLKKVNPFKEAEPELKYPAAQAYNPDTPSWLKVRIMKDRLKWGRGVLIE